MLISRRIQALEQLILRKEDSCVRSPEYLNRKIVYAQQYVNIFNPMHPDNANYLISRLLTDLIVEKNTPNILMCFGNKLCCSGVVESLHFVTENVDDAL
jgi:hypothetical protein